MELPCHRLTCVFVRLVTLIEMTLPGSGTCKQRIEQISNADYQRSVQLVVEVRNQLLHLPEEVLTSSQLDAILLPNVCSALRRVSDYIHDSPMVTTYTQCILTCKRRYLSSRCTCGFGIIFDACRILEHNLLPLHKHMLFSEKVESLSCKASIKSALRCIARIRTHAIHTRHFEISDTQRKAFNGAAMLIGNHPRLPVFHLHQTSTTYPCWDMTEYPDEVGDAIVETVPTIARTELWVKSVSKHELPVVMVVSNLLASTVDESSELIDNSSEIRVFYGVPENVIDNLYESPWKFVLFVLLLVCVVYCTIDVVKW
jgi:hypothetical protein